MFGLWTGSHVKGSVNWAEAHASLLMAEVASKLELKYVFLDAECHQFNKPSPKLL